MVCIMHAGFKRTEPGRISGDMGLEFVPGTALCDHRFLEDLGSRSGNVLNISARKLSESAV
jgi:hypothetical protein